MNDPFAALGLAPPVAARDVRKAYRRRLRALHPDLNATPPPDVAARLEALLEARDACLAFLDTDTGTGGWDPPATPTGFERIATTSPARRYVYAGRNLTADAVRRALSLRAHTGDLSRLAALPADALWRLDANDQPVTDAQLAVLPRFHRLHVLDLAGSLVTDAGLATIAKIPDLRDLSLWGTAITDAGLEHLAGMHRLDRLWIGDTAVTDDGLAHLAELRELDTVNLRGTAVRGPGLAHLAGLPDLDELVVDPKVPRATRNTFKTTRPDVHVIH